MRRAFLSALLSALVIAVFTGGLCAICGNEVSSHGTATLTVYVDGVNAQGGNVAVMVFRNAKGWPERNDAAYRAIVLPAHPGTMAVKVKDLPMGEYAIAVGHDVNLDRKVDRNWLGKPTEQWGMSNNPHPRVRTPSFASAKVEVSGNEEIHIQMQ